MAKKTRSTKAGEDGSRVVDFNKKARHDYEILDTLEVGLVLSGSEVKSVREGGISLRESYVRVKGAECFLVDCHIAPYKFSRKDDQEPYRERKLLLHKREIERLGIQIQQKGLTIVPLKVYFNARGRCKLELGVGRGKKLHDKRQDMKSKEAKRAMDRALKES